MIHCNYLKQTMNFSQSIESVKNRSSIDQRKLQKNVVLDNVELLYVMTFLWTKDILSQTIKPITDQIFKGFNLYSKISDLYAFESYECDLKQWGAEKICLKQHFKQFYRYMSGIGPKIVLKELIDIGQLYLKLKEYLSQKMALFQLRQQLIFQDRNQLDNRFSYIRFSQSALIQLKLEQDKLEIRKRVLKTWHAFIIIYSYALYCIDANLSNNIQLLKILVDNSTYKDDIQIMTLLEFVEQAQQDSATKQFQNSVSFCFQMTNDSQRFLNLSQTVQKKIDIQELKIQSQEKSDEQEFISEDLLNIQE